MVLFWKKCVPAFGAAVLSLAAAAQAPVVTLPPQALEHPELLIDGYTQMCETQSVTQPPPIGEGDIKDSPKLHAYCECFASTPFGQP